MSIAPEIENLYRQQIQDWKLAEENYTALSNVMIRPLMVNECLLKLQYNPHRIISTSAKVDIASIRERPCFLCSPNRPGEQKGISFLDEFLILVNPYPVFNHHFTIISDHHRPQRIRENFSKLLSTAEILQGYTIIYNGPACGASAPDHFHFQAFPKEILPLEALWEKHFTRGLSLKNVDIFYSDEYPGKMITLCGKERQGIEEAFVLLYRLLSQWLPTAEEPMMNVLACYRSDKWMIHVVPRRLHRPGQYFEQGEKQILLSPASIDMGGVLVIPRQEDFDRITNVDIEDIFSQVCVDRFFIREIMNKLTELYEQQ